MKTGKLCDTVSDVTHSPVYDVPMATSDVIMQVRLHNYTLEQMLHQNKNGEDFQLFERTVGIIQDLNHTNFLSSLLPNAFYQAQNVPKSIAAEWRGGHSNWTFPHSPFPWAAPPGVCRYDVPPIFAAYTQQGVQRNVRCAPAGYYSWPRGKSYAIHIRFDTWKFCFL